MSAYVSDDIARLTLDPSRIKSIFAVRFNGARSGRDVLNIIAHGEFDTRIPELERIEVEYSDERPSGTHAYEVTDYDGTFYCQPIWDKYIHH